MTSSRASGRADKIAFDDDDLRQLRGGTFRQWQQDGGLMIDAGDASVFLAGVRMNQIDAGDFLFA